MEILSLKKILKRAKAYHAHGHILYLELIDEHEWVAEVEGTEIYHTYIKIDGKYAEYRCNCPYDWGEICKHVVAVLYEIRETEAQFSVGLVGKILKKTVEGLTETQLREFVFDLAKQNSYVRQELLEEFGDEDLDPKPNDHHIINLAVSLNPLGKMFGKQVFLFGKRIF